MKLSDNGEGILRDLKKKMVCMIPLLSIFSSISYLSFVRVYVSLLEKLSGFCIESDFKSSTHGVFWQ